MTDMRQLTGMGRAIEDGSFAIIDAEVGTHHHDLDAWAIVRRVIHSTADFEYKDLVTIHPQAIAKGTTALRAGANLIVDVNMIASGLSEQRLKQYGIKVHCFISDDDVIAKAKAANSTRAIEAMRKAHALGLLEGSIVAIGNAPTALLELVRLAQDGGVRPALVVGVPVGFVSAAESKEAMRQFAAVPSIVTAGRKGGSPIAVAILHALMVLAEARSKEQA